jgi:F-type H+-transporting ATPase subunit delta
MQGASADSLVTLTEALTASVDRGADAVRIADDVFAVSAVLRREPSLRRIATDVSIDDEAKVGLVRNIFGDKLAPESLELVSKAAGRRWVSSRDLGYALELLGVIAVVKGADRAGQADDLEDELFAFGQLVKDNPELRDALSDPSRTDDDKRNLLHSLLDGKATPATIRLAEQSVTGTHRTVSVAIDEYQKVAAQHRSRLVATVRVARAVADHDAQRLASALSGQYGRPVHLNVVVDPDIIGGMRVEIGDDVIDGTVLSRLDDARRRLAG